MTAEQGTGRDEIARRIEQIEQSVDPREGSWDDRLRLYQDELLPFAVEQAAMDDEAFLRWWKGRTYYGEPSSMVQTALLKWAIHAHATRPVVWEHLCKMISVDKGIAPPVRECAVGSMIGVVEASMDGGSRISLPAFLDNHVVSRTRDALRRYRHHVSAFRWSRAAELESLLGLC